MMKWYMKWTIYELRIWNQVKLWSSLLWTQFLQLRKEAWRIQDFNGVWTSVLAIPVRRSNQLSYEATDVVSWSFVGSNVPVRNESMMKWYMKWTIHELRIWNQVKRRTGIARSRVQTPLKSWIFQALRNWKNAFITARIIASLDFISAVHIWSISYIISSLIHSSREHWNPQMTSSQRQWLHSSVG